MIRRPSYTLMSSEFEVFADEDSQTVIGRAVVANGIILELSVKDDATEDYKGEILSVLLTNVTQSADLCMSPLSIKIPPVQTLRLPRFLERFGFRQSSDGIFKRVSGSIQPPGVIY